MAFARHLQVTLQSATFVDPLSSSMIERMVYVKASHKNIVYTTNVVEGIGLVELHHMWGNDETNVFHFAYEDNSEDITLELFNRDHICIGVSWLDLAGLAKVMPEQDPELKNLPVSVGRRWSSASLALTVQIKRQQAMGKLGNLNVVLQEGIINSTSRLISPAATEPGVFAKLIYKHTTYTSEILRGERNKFVWHEHFTFRIDSWDRVDVLEICIYSGPSQVGECKVLLSLFINLEGNLQANRKDFVIRTEDLLVDKRSVGSIKVAGSFSTLHELDVLRAIVKGKRPELHPPCFPPPELRGLTTYASISNEIRGEGEIVRDIFHTDKSKSEVQLEFKEIWNAGKPTLIEDYLPIDLTRDLLGASPRGYVIRTICSDGQGGRYPCALKRIDTMDESEPDLARLCHPHVVHLLHHWKKKNDYGEVREWMPKSAFMTFLMMELMDGDLGNLMTSIKTTGLTPFSLLVAVHVMLQIAKGMLYLHEMGVSHPHLKCSNVLCRVKSTAQIPFRVGDVLVKLGGFGCSRAANDDTKNRDVFCFGLACLEILTGSECFEDIYGADKVSRPSIPETTPCILKDCIASCLDTKITFSEAISLLLLSQSQIIQTCEDKMILCSVNLDNKSTLSNNQDIASSSTSESDRQERFHVHQLHPQLGEVATCVQITLIFFHSFPKVSEEWRMTWLTRDNKLVWPQMWLPEDLGADIRVLSVSFNDNPNVSSTQSIMDLLKILVMSATCKLGETDQAIVLVGHSFGGVIIKALVAAAQGLAGKTADNNVEFQEVLKCKRFLMRLASIVFYSVPHAFANMGFENYISGCSNTRVLQRSSLLKALRRDSVFISDMIQLSRDFENAVPRKTKLLAFLEGKPMSKKSRLVTENSWEGPLLSWEWHKIDRDNHFEVCRPVSKSHIGYKVLLNHLQQHMCSPSAVNVRRVWKVIGTVLICICKFTEVLSRYRMVSLAIEGMTPKKLLLTCATAIELKDVSTIKQTVSALRKISSVNGEPSERVTAYFLQALQRRCVSLLDPKFLSEAELPSSREEQKPVSRWMLDVLTNFVDLSPYVRFGYVAANGAMLKAFEGMGRIHILDFSTTHGMQWRSFIDALADRVGGPPNFRLTLSGPSLPIVPHPIYEEIGHRLTKYARLRNVPLEFNVLAQPLERLSCRDFDVRDGEALGVNFSLGLHYLADESAGLPDYPPPLGTQLQLRCPRDNLLHLLHSLNPTIVTLYEEDCDATSTDVVKRVQQSYEHEWIPFDFMATLLPSGNKERQEYEKIVGMKIENIVACEGKRRIERLESRNQWMQRMRRLGFMSLPVGYDVESALRDILDHSWGMKTEVDECSQSLLWKGRSLAFASAWAPRFSNPAACPLDSGEHRQQQQECQKPSPAVLDSSPFEIFKHLELKREKLDAQGTVEEDAVLKELFEEKNETVELARLTRDFLLFLNSTDGLKGKQKMLDRKYVELMSLEALEGTTYYKWFQLALQESLQEFLGESWAQHVPNEIEKWYSRDHLRPLQEYLLPFQSELLLRPSVSLEQQNLKAPNDSETTLSSVRISEFRDSDPAVIRSIEESLGVFPTNQPAGMLYRKATILRALDGAAPGDTSDGGGAHGTALEPQQQQQSINAGHKMFKGPERAALAQVEMAESKRRPRYSIKTRLEVDLVDDGYKWRKYGQMINKNSAHPRNYYKCTTANCPARKRVERTDEDSSLVRTTYEGTHSHPANVTEKQWSPQTLAYLLQTDCQVPPQLSRRDTLFQTNLTLLRALELFRLHYGTQYPPVARRPVEEQPPFPGQYLNRRDYVARLLSLETQGDGHSSLPPGHRWLPTPGTPMKGGPPQEVKRPDWVPQGRYWTADGYTPNILSDIGRATYMPLEFHPPVKARPDWLHLSEAPQDTELPDKK